MSAITSRSGKAGSIPGDCRSRAIMRVNKTRAMGFLTGDQSRREAHLVILIQTRLRGGERRDVPVSNLGSVFPKRIVPRQMIFSDHSKGNEAETMMDAARGERMEGKESKRED